MTALTNLLPHDKDYFLISEISQIAQVPSHTLRYWESSLKLLRPTRLTSGHRRYTRKDLELVLKIKDLRYNKRYTLAGTKKCLADGSAKESSVPTTEILKEAKKELQSILNDLNTN